MLKLMKYEVKKQWLSKVVIFVVAAIFEAGFLIGLLTIPGNELRGNVSMELNQANMKLMVTSISLLLFLAIGALAYISFECIGTYSKDLKTKNSYMLFMTPHTSYSIVGAKLLTTGIQLFVSFLIFCGLGAIDMMIFITKVEGISKVKDYTVQFFNAIFQIDLTQEFFYTMCIYLLVTWVAILVIAILAITLSTTFLANNRLKGLFSAAIFLFILWGYGKIENLIIAQKVYDSANFIPLIISQCILIVAGYFGTAYMLDKKVNL